MTQNDALPMDAEPLMPHRRPMRMVDRLVACKDGGGEAIACVSPDSPFAREDGTLERVALLELMAQAYAAVRGYASRGGAASPGYLVSVQSLAIHGDAHAGEALRMRVTPDDAMPPFFRVTTDLRAGDLLLAEASMTMWIPE